MADKTTGGEELEQFLADLRKLREQAGQPSLRVMSRTAHYSHTALSSVVSGGRLPSLDLTLAFVRACAGDESEWRARWLHVRSRIAPENGTEADNSMEADNGSTEADDDTGSAGEPAAGRRRRRALMAAGAASLAAAAIAGATVAMMSNAATPAVRGSHAATSASVRSVSCPARPDPGDRPLVPCDDSRFVADVTIPDGTTVRAGQKFVKTWEIQNDGLVPWRGRFEQRQGILSGQGLCGSVSRVPVPATMPGQDALISVTFTAPNLPGSCRVDWKMTDKNGRLYFPYLGGLYVIVNVTG